MYIYISCVKDKIENTIKTRGSVSQFGVFLFFILFLLPN